MTQTKRRLIFLVGVPATGKSTWAANHFYDVVLSSDNYMDWMAKSFNSTYNDVFNNGGIKLAEHLFQRDLENFKNGTAKSAVIDRTNLSVSSRKKIIEKFDPEKFIFEAFVFNTPEKEEWVRRLNTREGKTIPSHVLDSMAKNFEYPTKEEGFANVTTV